MLLDEIEKAHDDVFNILLQVLDDGRLSDSHGHTVDFTNTIIVMTSNVGSQVIQKIAEAGGTMQEIREAVEQTLRTRFLPEILNRIDEKIVFHPLGRDQIGRIVDLQLNLLATRLEAQEFKLEVTPAARRALGDQGYDPIYGARPLKRVIQQQIANPLATELLKGEYHPQQTIHVDYQDDQFVFAAK